MAAFFVAKADCPPPVPPMMRLGIDCFELAKKGTVGCIYEYLCVCMCGQVSASSLSNQLKLVDVFESVHVCVSVSVHVCVSASMCVSVHVCVSVSMCVSVHVCVNVSICVSVCLCVC